jgi:hypothetical protein
MKLEAGKYYKLKDGSKAYILGRERLIDKWRGEYCHTQWYPTSWTFDGICLLPNRMELDIVSEWKEPIKGEAYLIQKENRTPAVLFNPSDSCLDDYKHCNYTITKIKYEEI